MPAPTISATYRGYVIRFDPPPIPLREMDYEFYHKDFDADPAVSDPRSGRACGEAEARTMIDEIEAERTDLAERAAKHADGIIDRMAANPAQQPERWRAVQEAIRFCAVRSGWRLNFVAANGAPYVCGKNHSVTFRDDTGTWDFFGAGSRCFHNLTDAVGALDV